MLSFPSNHHLADDDTHGQRPDPTESGETPGSAPSPRSVLVVEDEFLLALSIEEMVQEFGYSVCDCVATQRAALRSAQRYRPDIALMDIRLAQGDDGIETAKALRAQFGIRCIFISAHTDPATVTRMRDAEPVGFLTKPCEPPLLAALLQKAFGPVN